jgi:hypothetical protein
MPNLRVIYDNAADRATLSSSATLGALTVSNLVTDDKFALCRSSSNQFSIRATWPQQETIGASVFGFTNWSPSATMRVRATTEGQTTNLVGYSQQMDNSSGWSWTAVTATTGVAAPDGSTSAVTLQDTTANSAHEIRSWAINFVAGTTYTVSTFLKAGTLSFGYVGLPSAAFGVSTYAIFNLVSGSVALTNGTPSVVSIQPALNMPGWYRVSVTAVATISTAATTYVGMKAAAAAGAYAGDGAGTILAWGAQVEQGSLTSYYPTTSTALTRPLGYIDSWQSYAYDSGFVLCCPSPAVKLSGFTAAQASSAYGYGGGKYARAWIPRISCYGVAIDVADTNNLQGYVEAGRLIIGDYWEPVIGADQSETTFTLVDTSTQIRTEAGGMLVKVGPRHRKQQINLPSLGPTDRAKMWDILWGNGSRTPIFLSLYPNNSDTRLEDVHQLYGRLTTTPVMNTPYFNHQAAKLDIEEI